MCVTLKTGRTPVNESIFTIAHKYRNQLLAEFETVVLLDVKNVKEVNCQLVDMCL